MFSEQSQQSATLNKAYIVLLVLVALHYCNDAVVNKEGQSEDTSQLREEQPELWSKTRKQKWPEAA